MHLPEVKEFLSEVLIRIGSDVAVEDVAQVHLEEGYWGDLYAYNMTTSDGCEWFISCRLRLRAVPAHYVDFLDIESAQYHRHLIIVYLDSEQDKFSSLDSRYIPSKQWESVTHIDWARKHPFEIKREEKIEKVSEVILRDADQIQNEGGTRESETLITPLISIVTIVLNGDEYLEQTIQSVIHQKDSDLEYILVDGGSTDDSMRIINRYSAYIDYWISEPDNGLYDALNRGISLCRGKFVGAIHSNDFYSSSTIAELKKSIEQNPETSFFYGNLWYLDADRFWIRGREITSTFQMVMFGDFFHPTNFINRQAYEKKGTYDLSYHIAADYDLAVRFWKARLHFQYIPKAMAYFRLGGLSGNLYRNQWQRHQVRVANGEIYPYSLFVMMLVLGNYYLKAFGKKCLKAFFRE